MARPSLNLPTPKPNHQVKLVDVSKGDLANSGYIDKTLVPFTSSYINVTTKNGIKVNKLKEIVGTKELDLNSGFISERDFRLGEFTNRTQTYNPLTDKNTKYTLIKDDERFNCGTLSGKFTTKLPNSSPRL